MSIKKITMKNKYPWQLTKLLPNTKEIMKFLEEQARRLRKQKVASAIYQVDRKLVLFRELYSDDVILKETGNTLMKIKGEKILEEMQSKKRRYILHDEGIYKRRMLLKIF